MDISELAARIGANSATIADWESRYPVMMGEARIGFLVPCGVGEFTVFTYEDHPTGLTFLAVAKGPPCR